MNENDHNSDCIHRCINQTCTEQAFNATRLIALNGNFIRLVSFASWLLTLLADLCTMLVLTTMTSWDLAREIQDRNHRWWWVIRKGFYDRVTTWLDNNGCDYIKVFNFYNCAVVNCLIWQIHAVVGDWKINTTMSEIKWLVRYLTIFIIVSVK